MFAIILIFISTIGGKQFYGLPDEGEKEVEKAEELDDMWIAKEGAKLEAPESDRLETLRAEYYC